MIIRDSDVLGPNEVAEEDSYVREPRTRRKEWYLVSIGREIGCFATPHVYSVSFRHTHCSISRREEAIAQINDFPGPIHRRYEHWGELCAVWANNCIHGIVNGPLSPNSLVPLIVTRADINSRIAIERQRLLEADREISREKTARCRALYCRPVEKRAACDLAAHLEAARVKHERRDAGSIETVEDRETVSCEAVSAEAPREVHCASHIAAPEVIAQPVAETRLLNSAHSAARHRAVQAGLPRQIRDVASLDGPPSIPAQQMSASVTAPPSTSRTRCCGHAVMVQLPSAKRIINAWIVMRGLRPGVYTDR